MSDYVSTPTAVIVLAAGTSLRMGRPKQSLDVDGQPLLRRAARQALGAACGPVFVVLGAREQDMRPLLDGLPVQVVTNDRWAEGIGTSIQAGLHAADGRGLGAALLALADQPLVTPAMLRQVAARLGESGSLIVASRYAGTVGVPACFAREVFPDLMALAPDEGCKSVIRRRVAGGDVLLIDCPEAAVDLDTPEDYRRVTGATWSSESATRGQS